MSSGLSEDGWTPARKGCAGEGDDIGSGLECQPVLQFCAEGHRGLVVDIAARDVEHWMCTA